VKTENLIFFSLVHLGELMKDKDVKHKPYKNIIKSVQSIVRAEGWRGLQKGLTAQTAFQFTMNSVRLGTYQTLDDYGFLKRDKHGKLSTMRCVAVGAISGFSGVTFSCPFYMIKTQLQSQSANVKYAVGYQHKHKGLVDALKSIYTNNGMKGLWKGYTALIPRNMVGSSVQLSSFSRCKEFLGQYPTFENSIFLSAVVSSMLTGLVTCVFMTPFDTAATRMFNQPVGKDGKGLLYRNIVDVFIKVTKTEGFFGGFYKGFGPNYFRMAPQHLLNLTFWEKFKEMNRQFQGKK
jgi:solute carrier family 25, member 34/35